MRVLLDHSIIGQREIGLTFRKDREFAGCAICGALFQARLAMELPDDEWDTDRLLFETAVAIETKQWREDHNRKHTEKEHRDHVESGLTFSPEAAHRLAPYGLVPITDGEHDEVAHAMLAAPRAPQYEVETTLKGWR